MRSIGTVEIRIEASEVLDQINIEDIVEYYAEVVGNIYENKELLG